jgi:hypothetical protein
MNGVGWALAHADDLGIGTEAAWAKAHPTGWIPAFAGMTEEEL